MSASPPQPVAAPVTASAAAPPVVVARQLSRRFGSRLAVDHIDLCVPQGGCFGLLGPNGAGKTTTLRMILGLCRPTSGTLEVLGLPVPERMREIRARVGVVPQSDNQDPDFTVEENLRVYARYFGLRPRQVSGRIDELLEFLELGDRRRSRIRELSGGIRRRLSIARALINDPELIILDEPSTGLDPQVRHLIWTRLRQLRAAGKTLLLTTHYMDEAERLCDELVVMDRGRIVVQGAPRRLIASEIEAHVLEIRGEAATIGDVLEGLAGTRLTSAGDTHYCYTSELTPLLERLERAPRLTFTHRPANLEDVFLKLTGHELRD